MPRPEAVGHFTALALAIASKEALKGPVHYAVEVVHKLLRDKIALWAAGDVDALEQMLTSPDRMATIAKIVELRPRL
jgi:hypothetical protein